MKIGVVIPAYNAAAYLGQTLASFRRQSGLLDLHAVVVDDGSRDDTLALARTVAAGDSRIRVIGQPNGGVSVARNTGFRKLDGDTEAVLFLDADDVLWPDALARLAAALDSDAGASAVHGHCREVGPDGQPLAPDKRAVDRPRMYLGEDRRLLRRARDEPATLAALLFDNYIVTPGTVLIRKGALDALDTPRGADGPFDPELRGPEDWHLWARLAYHGRFACLDEIVLDYRRHPGSATARQSAIRASTRLLRRKFATDGTFDEATRKFARQSYRAAERHQAGSMFRLGFKLLASRGGRRSGFGFLGLSGVKALQSVPGVPTIW